MKRITIFCLLIVLSGCAAVDYYVIAEGSTEDKASQPIVDPQTAFKYMRNPKTREAKLLFHGRTPESMRTRGLNYTCDIFMMNSDGTELKNLTNTPDHDELNPVWGEGGQVLFIDNGMNTPDWENWKYYLINTDGSGRTEITKRLYDDYFDRWMNEKHGNAWWKQ